MSIPADINPGIRKTVEWLQSHGFKTCDSGDGETHDHECDLPMPYVHIMVPFPELLVEEADRLASLLKGVGIEIQPCNEDNSVPTLHAGYDAGNRVATISLFNVKL